jgi:hypothetical protein
VVCTNVSGQATCQCWDFTGTHVGYAATNAWCVCPGSATYPWN